MNEQIHFDPTAQPYNTSKTEPVGFALGAGIFFLPYIFVWFLLRKNTNYSKLAKVISFGWLAFLVLTVFASSRQSAPPTMPPQTVAQAVAPIAPAVPAKLEKPTTPRNPNHIKRLSGASPSTGPSEADKLEQAWDDYDQQECTDKTLAQDKKNLVTVQSARLEIIQNAYKYVIKHNEGDAIAVIRATKYLDAYYNKPENKAKLIYTTPCLTKRGNIPAEASDINYMQERLNAAFDRLIKAYDGKYDSEGIVNYEKRLQNYKIQLNQAQTVLKSVAKQ